MQMDWIMLIHHLDGIGDNDGGVVLVQRKMATLSGLISASLIGFTSKGRIY